MISVFRWPDPNTGFDQSEHALYTCYFIMCDITRCVVCIPNNVEYHNEEELQKFYLRIYTLNLKRGYNPFCASVLLITKAAYQM